MPLRICTYACTYVYYIHIINVYSYIYIHRWDVWIYTVYISYQPAIGWKNKLLLNIKNDFKRRKTSTWTLERGAKMDGFQGAIFQQPQTWFKTSPIPTRLGEWLKSQTKFPEVAWAGLAGGCSSEPFRMLKAWNGFRISTFAPSFRGCRP